MRRRADQKRRARCDALAADRMGLLLAQGIDGRLLDAVWGAREGVLGDLLAERALTAVEWLDEIAVDQPGVVPVLSLRREREGIVAVNGWLLHLYPDSMPVQRDLLWTWQRLLADPIDVLLRAEQAGGALPAGLRCGDRLDESLLALELERLRGPALGDWVLDLVRQARQG